MDSGLLGPHCIKYRGDAGNESEQNKTAAGRVGFCRRRLVVLFILDVDQNVLHSAIQKGTEIVERDRADRLIVLQPIQKTSANAEFMNELVGRYSFFFHG